MQVPANKELREFIADRFDDKELDNFCFDYFLEVRNDFSSGLRKSDKVKDLIGYCRRRELMQNLIVSLKQERGDVYQQTFAPEQPPQRKQKRLVYTSKPRNPRKLFVSHSSKDADLARQIAADLQANGYEIFITPNSIQPGEKWVPAIGRGMEESGIFLVLLTTNAVQSSWVHDEVNMAIALAHENEMQVFLLDVQACKVPIVWRQRQLLSFRDNNTKYKKNMANLLAVFGEKVAAQAPLARPKNDDARVNAMYAQLLTAQAVGNWLNVLMLSAQIEILAENYRDVADLKVIALQQLQKPIVQPAPIPKIIVPKPKTAPLSDHFIHEKTGLEFVCASAGDFLYGDGKEKRTLPEFWMSKTPVTNAIYKRFIDANPKYDVPYQSESWAKVYNWDKKKRIYQPDKAEHPVVLVSWYDAVAFCKWAGLQLPTEERWEKAARGMDGRKYPWGNNDPTYKLCNFDSNVGETSPVGNYSPQGDSPYNCVDMSGNVWEWCLNKHSTPDDTKIDKSDASRVLRGGSWPYDTGDVCAACRSYDLPDNRDYDLGFRVAVVRPPSQ